ncbi:MAG: small nuclear ribonucleoprotein [Candidatus Lokiarchaeota archaeon]|nr:small nuclear ribonucleoprotein [Candidatus Lokiarchaeota archaeon]
MIGGNRPLELLTKSLETRVLIKLKGRRELRGKLRGFDQHMNLVLDEAEEINSNKEGEQIINQLGTIIVRGDNVIIISPPRLPINKEGES